MRLALENLTFTGKYLGSTSGAPSSLFVLNNTGNFDFTSINITAYDLEGVTDSSYKIGAGNFTLNTTDTSGIGIRLANATSLSIGGAGLYHKQNDSDTGGNMSLYLWVDIPSSSEIIKQDYTSSNWSITVK
jgi:hypothetical protein